MAKQSLKEKLKKRREELKKRSGGKVFFPKEGTTRFRVLPTGDEDWAVEVTSFYLGSEIKGVFSPVTLDKACPIMEHYESLKGSDSDLKIKKALSPRKKFLIPVLIYEGEDGKKIDASNSGRLMQVPSRIYTQMIDIFLDSDFPEFNDPEEGFDFKLKREGTTLTNTTYTITPLRSKPIHADWKKVVDPEDMLEEVIDEYDELESKLAQFLAEVGEDDDGEDDEATEEKPRKRKKRRKEKGDA